MNSFLAFLVKTLIAVPTALATWLVSLIAFNQTFLVSTALAGGGGLLAYGTSSLYMKYRFLKKHRLTRKEFQYISKNLQEAKRKIYRLHKTLLSIRHIPSLSQRIELSRLTRKIYGLTKKEPKRFYQAEQFYFSHLDSAVELTEKYVFLSSQPKKNVEIEQALAETRRTLEELNHLIEEDLYQVISDDLDDLHFEIDVAKQSIQQETQLLKESRK